MVHLVTGYAGQAHIKSADDGAFNAALLGNGQYILESGNQFKGSIIDNNTIRILDGDGVMYGRHFRVEPNSHEDLTIQTGTAGKNRIDLVCITYEKNAENETEKAFLEVVKGTETSGTASIPTYTAGDILAGAAKNQMPLYKVTIEGVVLSKIEPLFTIAKSMKSLEENQKKVIKDELAKRRTMHIGIEVLGVATTSTKTISEVIDLMDNVADMTFFVSSSRYPKIYEEVLEGIKSVDSSISSIGGHVTIRKNGSSSYISVEDYINPNNKFETIYNNKELKGWGKIATGIDVNKKVGFAASYPTITPTNAISDMLDIDFSNPFGEKNQPRKVYQQTSDAAPIANMPSLYPKGTSFVGMRYVHYFSATNILVELVPFPGYRSWYNNYSGNSWKGWNCEPTNANGETMSKLRTDLDSIGGTVSNACVEIGFNDNIKVRATVCMKKLSNSKCDLHISYKIASNAETNTSLVNLISGEKLRAALGVSSLTASASQCFVNFTPCFDASNSELSIISVETTDVIMGATGVGAQLTQNGFSFGRMYEKSDGAYAFGIWPIVNQKETLFKAGTYGRIDVYGADFKL